MLLGINLLAIQGFLRLVFCGNVLILPYLIFTDTGVTKRLIGKPTLTAQLVRELRMVKILTGHQISEMVLFCLMHYEYASELYGNHAKNEAPEGALVGKRS